ncbi:ribonuclease HII [Jannaschia seohaensis]|uniref:Ribonuclease HII n=1 Tax=Jannaschia seohaensis TaxID=475081 RepID=A0A2Y9AUD0_9RHOB|nr:ribonuclease HII [Jannaschia seohaensis]PWJ17489.1 RNase HII [Jannaschia seohaensis]SSA47585.1 RNase HII [Jannaschia seohaensis]
MADLFALPDLAYEARAKARGARAVAGLDEVGRGPWAGPVTACAFILTGDTPEGLTDSKKLPPRRRAAMLPALRDAGLIAIGEASVEEIDRLNIRQATHLAMRRAVEGLAIEPDHLLIDGTDRPAWVDRPHDLIKRGDARSLSISAASVMAKTWRDEGMTALAQQFPGYGWETNMGYGTSAHLDGLKCHGVTPHHRRSFAPIRKILCP